MIFKWIGVLFALLLLVIAAWSTASALSWRKEVAMFPLFVGISAIALTGAVVIREGRSIMTAKKLQRISGVRTVEENDTAARAWQAPCWFFGFVVTVLLLGIPVGLPIMLLLLIKYGFGENWLHSIVTVCIIETVTLVFFGMIYGVVWPEPFLMKILL
jgi:hypothetical protein